jgi:hypothetical protein
MENPMVFGIRLAAVLLLVSGITSMRPECRGDEPAKNDRVGSQVRNVLSWRLRGPLTPRPSPPPQGGTSS